MKHIFFVTLFAWSYPSLAIDLSGLTQLGKKSVASTLQVIRLSDQKILLEQDPKQALTPASVTKLVTAAALLQTFKPAYTFKTSVYYTGTLIGGIISGDLIFVGDGDPFLVSEKLWPFAADLRQMGVRRIRGNLIIDNSLFDDEAFDESRNTSTIRSENAYDAPISAFAINFNTVTVSVFPAFKNGLPPSVDIDPYQLDSIKFRNTAKTSKGKGQSMTVRREVLPGQLTNAIEVSGTIGNEAKLSKFYRSHAHPVILAGQYVKAFLKHEGITIDGGIKSQIRPINSQLLYTIDSYPMTRLIDGLNKFSNNFIADVLTKRLGAEKNQNKIGSGSLENGVLAMTSFMKIDVGISGTFVLKNGSGLDTSNLISAEQLNKLLVYASQHLEIFPEFLASLPAAGWDGTLKKRLKNNGEMAGLVRAKTGTLSEPIMVAALSGYLQHPKHGNCAFTLIQNGIAGSAQPSLEDLRNYQDELLAAFIQQ